MDSHCYVHTMTTCTHGIVRRFGTGTYNIYNLSNHTWFGLGSTAFLREHLGGGEGGGCLSLTVVGGVEATDVADAAHPLVHLVLRVRHQVEHAVDGLDVEDEAVLQVLLVEGQTGVHLEPAGTKTPLSVSFPIQPLGCDALISPDTLFTALARQRQAGVSDTEE